MPIPQTNQQPARKPLLIFSQTFLPDPASVGQHMADVARAMVARGHRVIVYTSDRGYDDPSLQYPPYEIMDGIEVRRLPWSSFGKQSIWSRLLGLFGFATQCAIAGLLREDISGVLFSTSPPLIGAVGAFVGIARRVPVGYWVMDLNPDQLIALGKLKATSWRARVLLRLNRFILIHSAIVIALDRFMESRIRAIQPDANMIVIPPWPHEDHSADDIDANKAFRALHGLTDKFVIMYSGNHTYSNPLTTLLQAAEQLKNDDRIMFVFIGGGVAKGEVEDFARIHALPNILCLPYQPFEELPASLAAADVHVVSLGSSMVGIIHPCKIYGAMAVNRPILYLGPSPSHITDLLDQHPIGRQVRHGDVANMIQVIQALATTTPAAIRSMGATARHVLDAHLSQNALCGAFCIALEHALQLPAHGMTDTRTPVP